MFHVKVLSVFFLSGLTSPLKCRLLLSQYLALVVRLTGPACPFTKKKKIGTKNAPSTNANVRVEENLKAEGCPALHSRSAAPPSGAKTIIMVAMMMITVVRNRNHNVKQTYQREPNPRVTSALPSVSFYYFC